MKMNVGESTVIKVPFWKKGVDVQHEGNILSIDRKHDRAYIVAAVGKLKNTCMTLPLGPIKELNDLGFNVKIQSKTRILVSVGRALFVVDYAAKKIATSVVGLRAFGNGEWGENVQMPWRGDYPALFDQPANTDDMDLNFAKLFWHWFSVNETDIVKMLNKGKKEEKSVYYQTHLWLCPAFPYAKPNAIRFDLVPGDEKHRFVFHHGGNEALMDDAPAMGGLMPEGLADRWDFQIEE